MCSREPEQLRELVANVRLYSHPILVHSYVLSWYALWLFDEPEPGCVCDTSTERRPENDASDYSQEDSDYDITDTHVRRRTCEYLTNPPSRLCCIC